MEWLESLESLKKPEKNVNRQILFIASLVTALALAGLFLPRHRRAHPGAPLHPRPTACGLPPPVTEIPPLGNRTAYHLPADDWRQVEFVANGDREVVNRELAELASFKAAKRSGSGWTEVYVRTSRPESIAAARAPFSQMAIIAGAAGSPIPLFVDHDDHDATKKTDEVKGGFAIRLTSATVVYGYQDNGIVISLNLDTRGEERDGAVVAALCAELEKRYGLFLVDWDQDRIIPPG